MVRRKFISTRILKPGMVIDQSIIDSTGRVLLGRKTPLDEYYINALQKLGIGGVYIREGEEEEIEENIEISPEVVEKIEKMRVADKAKLKLSESVKARVSEGIQYLYSNPESEGFTDAASSISNDLMKAITDNDAIAIDISTLKVSDEYTFKHSVDVASMSMIIAKRFGLDDKQVYQIGISGLLHDLGKSQIPNEILNKPGKLSDEEFTIMKNHPLIGYNIIKDKPDIAQEIKMGVLQHHEKINGRGYPLGLEGNRIHNYARILSVADIYDALVTERPYKKAFTPRDAVEMIMAMTGELDFGMIQSFLDSVVLYPVDSVVTLSTGEHAKVVQNNPGYPMRPKVVTLRQGKVYDLANDIAYANVIVE
ncbi:MAG: HD-GYP domain-containing protein [Clostridium sp.]|nr:HD-GYP domain-containing protein [Clostridium sp.]